MLTNLNHAQEIIFQFLVENKAIFIGEDSQIDFAAGNGYFLNFSLRPPPPCQETFQRFICSAVNKVFHLRKEKLRELEAPWLSK